MPSRINLLSQEDLVRWRLAVAEKELVDLAFPGMSVDEARRGLLLYYKTLAEVIRDYSLSDETRNFHISPIDGGIYIGVESELA